MRLISDGTAANQLFFLGLQPPFHGTAHQIFRIRSAEGLHRFIRVADQHQLDAGIPQLLQEAHAGQRGVLNIIHNQQPGQAQRLHTHRPVGIIRVIGDECLTHHTSACHQQIRGIQTVLPRIYRALGCNIFTAQRESQTPLHRQSRVLRHGVQETWLFVNAYTELIQSGQHIAQLADKRI